jgi:adrenodoxin-NADP+ reductase
MDHVTIIGQGNVALDIARMLLASPSELSQYDVPESVLELLSRSAVKHVSIVGRRGPYEAAFTTKELRELMNLPEASMIPLEPSLLQPRPGATVSRQQSRIIQLLQKGSKNTPGTTPKTWSLDFFRSPLGLAQPSPAGADAHARLTLAHTELDDAGRARATSHTSVLPTSLVVTSLGHRSEPTHPHYDPALGHVRNVGGRVIDANGQALRHVYTSGWAAMGARGVLASTMLDAHMVADAIIADSLPRTQETTSVTPRATPDIGPDAVRVMNGDPNPDAVPAEIASALHAGLVTTYEDWKLVDAEEVDRGQKVGKERERMGWAQASAFLERARAAHN